MTVRNITVTRCEDAFQLIEEMTVKKPRGFVFRGHKNSNWRIETTLRRHASGKRGFMPTWGSDYEQMLAQFFTRLIHIGMELPFKDRNRRAQLEFGRHHGLPSPVVDVSYSPFVALFFAFNGIRSDKAGDNDYSVLNCINVAQLCLVFARERSKQTGGDQTTIYHRSMSAEADMFQEGFSDDDLRFISAPASWNKRMHRQMGCFIYESMKFQVDGFKDLEYYMNQDEVPCDPPEDNPMLLRISIPHSVGREVFERLDLMAINATHLYDSHEGAVMDVINSYNYGRRSGFAWDMNSFR